MSIYRFVRWKSCHFIVLTSLVIGNWAEAGFASTIASPSTDLISIYRIKEVEKFTAAMATDTDHDGVDDANDLDDDNDGIFDTAEAVGGNNPVGDADGDGILNHADVTGNVGSGDGSSTDYTDSDGNDIPDVYDVDGDGIANHLDLDSDNDGVPDNIEAQTTLDYIVPNADNAATYTANNGLNSAYTLSGGYTRDGILPIDTDGNALENLPDYLDTDSDDEGEIDTKEAGFVVASSNADVDGDGLLNAYERGTTNDGYVPNDGITNPSVIFTDTDSDVNSGGDVDYRDATNDASGVMCGPVSTLYQTVGNSGTGKSEVYRYNPFLQQYLKVGELDGASNSSASNSAYNAVTQYVYSNDGGGKTLRVYDPADDFAFVGEITITGTTQNFNNVLFAQENLLGFIANSKIIKFDVSSITSYPATVGVTEIAITGTFSTSADYALLGDYVYGVTGSSPARLVKVHVNTGVSERFDLTLANNTSNNDALGGTYGAAWQDRFGNFYTFNNANGDIYKIADVENATTGTALTKILLANTSNQNDGFGCELNPDPLDWDGDTYGDEVDLDDDNDGILDVVEDANPDGDNDPLTNFTDTDGDNIPDGYDLDSDGDGLPDNVEAQTTAGYTAPGGTYTDGLDDTYSGGLTPVNTDGAFPNSDAIPDYRDVDADNDGTYDIVEANLVLSGKDYDGDGLDNNLDTTIGLDDPNGTINDPSALPNTSGIGDIDVRDAKDTDGDGIQDVADADDDNDGILDTEEVSGGYDPLGDADGDGAPNFSDVSNGVGGGDGSTTDYTDNDSNGIPDVYDIDGDGIANHLDLDSENDGIYDAVEAGHGQAQTGGIVDGNVGTDGLPDAVQDAGQEDSGLVNYTLADSEATPDGTADFLETDADGDGCNDVKEAGFTDGDDNGLLGSGTFGAGLMVNTNGIVTSGSDGYTAPNVNYTNDAVKIACNRPPTSASKTLTTNEDTPVTMATADLGYSDPDGDALSKITIHTAPASGTMFLDANNDNVIDGGEALAANGEVTKTQLDDGKLKFLPAANGNGAGYADFDFTVNDSFTDAISSNTITFDVTAVNDAPTAADKTLTTNEGTLVTVSTADLGYNDVDGDVLNKITIDAIPTAGTLFLDADTDDEVDAEEELADDDEVTKTQLDNGELKFLPDTDGNGAGYADFDFTVNDGTIDATSTSKITFDVDAVNDVPTASDKTLTTDEDTPAVVATTDLGYVDIDGDALSKITINQVPATGTLFLDADDDNVLDAGEELADDDEVTRTQLDDGELKFLPVANENGTGYANFNFTVNDGTVDAAGTNTITFNVTAVNDAPAAVDKTLTTNEDEPVTIATADLGYNDLDGDALNKITINTTPALGSLFLDADSDDEVDAGEVLATNDEVTKAQLDDGQLKFLPATDGNGAGYASFDFTVNDGTIDATGANTVTFDVTAVNDVSVVDLDQNDDSGATGAEYQTSFTEGDTDVAIADTDVSFTDIDDTELTSMTLILTNRPDGAAESLSVSGTLPAGITVSDSYDNSDGQLVLSGAASLAGYQTALQLVGYNNTSEDPDNTDRTITVVVNDGDANSNTATTTLSVTSVNDAPVTNNGAVTINAEEEGTDYALNLEAPTDVDDASLVIKVTELPALGTITLADGTPVSLNQILTSVELTGLEYDAPEDYDGTTPPGDFTYSVSDGDVTVTQTVDINLSTANDDPAITVPAAQNTNEDTPLVFIVANSNTISLSDNDGDAQTVTITATNGTLSLSQTSGLTFTDGDGSEDASMTFNGSIADINAALSGASFVPDANYNGSAEVEISTTDGTASDNETIAISVNSVNDVPTASDNTITSDEDTDYTFAIADFNYADIESQLDHIEITDLPDNGTLFLDANEDGVVDGGETVALNQDIDGADISKLKFRPEPDMNGNSYGNFNFLVHDGTAYALASSTITINITAKNDAPIAADKTLTTDEDVAVTINIADLGYTDIEDDDLSKITIDALPGAGTLFVDADNNEVIDAGEALSANGEVTKTQLDDGQLKFLPATDENGAGYAIFDFIVNDGTDDAAIASKITFDVTAVNDAPTAANNTVTTTENITYTFALADFGYADIEGTNIDHLEITSLPNQGTLFADADGDDVVDAGETISLNQVINVADISKLKFQPVIYESGAAYAAFDFIVNDGNLDAAQAHTITIDVDSINNLPTAANKTLTSQEDTPIVITTTDLGFSDPDGDVLSKITISLAPAHGNLFLDGNNNNLPDDGEALSDESEVSKTQLDAAQLKFLPAGNENGAAYSSFGFTVNDGIADATGANTITFDVTEINDAPTATGSTLSIQEDTYHTFALVDFGYSDVDNDALHHIRMIELPEHGILFIDADNDDMADVGEEVALDQDISATEIPSLKYKPAAHTGGTDTFDFLVNDGTVNSAQNATLQITVTPVDDAPPVATGKIFVLDAGASLNNGSLTDAVTDPEGLGLTFQTTPSVDANHGTLTLHSDGTFTYIPDAGFAGTDNFTYQVCDAGDPQECITGTVTLQVNGQDQEADTDGDGIKDSIEKGNDPENPVDSDGDGEPDYLDTDSDNDGIADSTEVGGNTETPVDTDQDGIPDFIDTDSDDDGLSDTLEVGNHPAQPTDTDGDGIPDFQETDSDDDGLPDTVEAGDNPAKPTDTDGDGIPDFQETDSDGDGLSDGKEAGDDPVQPTDTDGDGTPDYQETDSDGDGISDSEETDSDGDGIQDALEKGADLSNPVDTDNDGTPDYLDTDADNDGVPDTIEAGIENAQTMADLLDTDEDGIPDFQDADDDNDGILTIHEDIDKDGNAANDNTDDDEKADYLDVDDDNDGKLTENEYSSSAGDCDGDLMPDYLDPDHCGVAPDEGFSPNNDGIGDAWQIKGIEDYPNNQVKVFNRWGNLIYQTKDYNNNDNAWLGQANGRLLLGDNNVPDGTYFYVIDLGDHSKPLSGYIVLKR